MTRQSVLAIDGGGSKTLIALADSSGKVTAMASGRGINPMDNPHWRDDLGELFRALGHGSAHIAGAAAALPAYGEVASVSQAQHEAMAELLSPVPRRILNDVDAAHYGAFAGKAGILVLSGTGSMAWARDAEGNSFRVGGWGEAIGDEGSSYWIGMRTIGLASQSIDGRADAAGLVEGLFTFLDLDRSNPQDSLTAWVAGLVHGRSGIAALSFLIDQLAEKGDPDARAIIDAAADHLALHATAIAKHLGKERHAWSYAGGTFRSRTLLNAVARKIGTPPRPPILSPIGGALLCAANDLDWPVDEAFIGRLAASIENNAGIAT
ncbi:MAG TPA: BadF/BadG/BcrA/BcrD ATPase family protein [Devosiaceae bacterium]|nr:BadF/BadG/BcrA/BcrD ATPase family protein [Devosiaceae bacterium]